MLNDWRMFFAMLRCIHFQYKYEKQRREKNFDLSVAEYQIDCSDWSGAEPHFKFFSRFSCRQEKETETAQANRRLSKFSIHYNTF